MAARRMGMILLLCLCLCIGPACAQASSTADAKEFIAVQNDCTLTLTYRSGGTNLAGVPVELYQVATVSSDFQYTLTPAYAGSDLVLNGVQTIGEWNIIRSTLEAYILAGSIAPEHTAQTDQTGLVRFDALQPGLYLARAATVVVDGYTYCIDAALIALPGLSENGLWQYDVAVTSKMEVIPPVLPDEKIELKVLKLWKGDSGSGKRPKSIQVEIFRNGVSENLVTLSAANNWTHTWSAADDGATWTVVERNIPSGYTMSVEKRETSFIVTNKLKGTLPPDSPQTGDTSDIMLYTVLMWVSGVLLILIAITGKRKRHEEEK